MAERVVRGGRDGQGQTRGIWINDWPVLSRAVKVTLERPFHQGSRGGIGKPVLTMPVGKCSQALSQCVDRQRSCMGGEVAGHTVCRGREEAAPDHLEVSQGRRIAALRVLALGSLQVAFKGIGRHVRSERQVTGKHNATGYGAYVVGSCNSRCVRGNGGLTKLKGMSESQRVTCRWRTLR